MKKERVTTPYEVVFNLVHPDGSEEPIKFLLGRFVAVGEAYRYATHCAKTLPGPNKRKYRRYLVMKGGRLLGAYLETIPEWKEQPRWSIAMHSQAMPETG